MSSSQSKVINRLCERRQIEADLRGMLAADSALEFRRQAERIAALGSPILPVIVANLDRANGQMLDALGTVASFLDRGQVVGALRQVLRQPDRTDQGRTAALTILESYLGEPVDDGSDPSLASAATAVSAAKEALEQARTVAIPTALLEYVRGLDQQEPDVCLAVIRALRDVSGEKTVELLRLMAQDVREEIAAEAVQALGSIRLPEAAWALQTLIPTSAPAVRQVAERLVRKLQFAGVRVNPMPSPSPEWRALISPIDGLGMQSVWFLQGDRGAAQLRFINVVLSERAGVVEGAGYEGAPGTLLPPRRPTGYVHDIVQFMGPSSMLMLEASFDLGRRLVAESLVHNRETQIPVGGGMRLLSPWLWAYSSVDLPPKSLPELTAEDASLVTISDRLLAHPAAITWTAHSEHTSQAADEVLHRQGWDLQVWVRRLAGELFAEPATARLFHQRLVALSEWLHLAGEELWAKVALVAAHAMLEKDPQQMPFVRALIQRDLERAVHSLRESSGSASGSDEV